MSYTSCAEFETQMEAAINTFKATVAVPGTTLAQWIAAWKVFADAEALAWSLHGKPGKRPKNPPAS